MKKLFAPSGFLSRKEIKETAHYIKNNQLPSGGIPWFTGGILDPWDHVESAMGLASVGFLEEAKRAYMWMIKVQESDGGFFPAYDDMTPVDTSRKESHHAPYFATGVYHYFLITHDICFLKKVWEGVEAAVEFSLSLQSGYGEIYWASLEGGEIYKDALITGCSSIYKSLECAILLASELGLEKNTWIEARDVLGEAILRKRDRFDRTWESKSRFAMDWFYPVLCGIYRGREAKKRLKEKWDIFVETGLGCRCVKDEPWVTVAESCELVLSLLSAGEFLKALELFSWLRRNRDRDGGYWTGYQIKEKIFWPREKPTWTAGVLLLAIDGLMRLSPAWDFFIEERLSSSLKYRPILERYVAN